MKDMTRDVTGRVFLFAGLTAAMYFVHLLSWKKEHDQKPGNKNKRIKNGSGSGAGQAAIAVCADKIYFRSPAQMKSMLSEGQSTLSRGYYVKTSYVEFEWCMINIVAGAIWHDSNRIIEN